MVGSLRGRWRAAARRLSQSIVFRAPGERNDCPACGSRVLLDLDLLPQRGGVLAFVTGCEDCGLVFANPQPTAEALARFYSPSGTWVVPHAHAAAIPHMPKRYGRAWARRFGAIADELSVIAPPPSARVLDFGCGDGSLLDRL